MKRIWADFKSEEPQEEKERPIGKTGRSVSIDSRGQPHAREISTGLFARITGTLKKAISRLFRVKT